MRQRKTNEEFIREMKNINPNIKILGSYSNAHTKVDYQCLIDNNIWCATPNNLLQGKGCPVCAKLHMADKLRKTHQHFIDEMLMINPDISIIGKYIDDATKIKCKCVKCKNVWMATPSNLLRGHGCSKCAGNNKKTHKQFIEELYNINPNIRILGNYCGVNTKVRCKCLLDDYEWESLPSNLLKGYGCPQCATQTRANLRRKTHKIFEKDLYRVNPTVEILGEYIDAKTKIKCRCKVDGFEWDATPNNLLRGRGCPKCNASKGEIAIAKFLNNNDIYYITQHKFDDCKNALPLPFDFYLPNYNICIEYDGEQHYRPIEYFGGEEKFVSQKQNDNIKNDYCRDNNIKLLRIPYWKFDDIEEILNTYLIECG